MVSLVGDLRELKRKEIFTISGHILVATGSVSVVSVCPFASAIHSGGCCGCQYVGIKGLVVAMLLLLRETVTVMGMRMMQSAGR